MEWMNRSGDGEHPGGDDPRPGSTPLPTDALRAVTDRLAGYDASPSARALLAQVLAATLQAFTLTTSVRDPLPDTAPGSAEEALAVLAGIDHLRSSLGAVDAAWQVLAEQRIRTADQERGEPASQQGRGAAHEIGLARRISPASSSFSLTSARRLVQHMPGTVERLWEGKLTHQQASTIGSTLEGASPETCARLDEIIHGAPQTLHGMGPRQLRSALEEQIQRLEPENSRARAERAARARHLTMTPLADGMARVTAVLRGIDAVGMMNALTKQAESLRAAGVRDSVPALEADLLVDAVRQHPAAPRRPNPTPGVDVGIVITDTALLDRDDDAESARLEGYGTLPAHIVRDTLLGTPPGSLRDPEDPHPDEQVTAFYRRLYAAPRTGDLVGMESRARAFPAGLARIIRWRDTSCRTPWCNAKIRQSDHAIPYYRGGATSYGNGQGLCVRCNLLKEHGLWVLTPLSPQSAEGDPLASAPGNSPSAQAPPQLPPPPGSAPPTGSPPPPASPPTAWAWTSPHGAQGISYTPPVIQPLPSQDPGESHAPEGESPDPPGSPPST